MSKTVALAALATRCQIPENLIWYSALTFFFVIFSHTTKSQNYGPITWQVKLVISFKTMPLRMQTQCDLMKLNHSGISNGGEKGPVASLDLSNIVARSSTEQPTDHEKRKVQQSFMSSNGSGESDMHSNLFNRYDPATLMRIVAFFAGPIQKQKL